MPDYKSISKFIDIFSRLTKVGFLEDICGFFASNVFEAHRQNELTPKEELVFYELFMEKAVKYGLKLHNRRFYI